jgi:hypothetical protein
MVGFSSEAEPLTVGPRLVAVPKVKSAFTTSAAVANSNTNVSETVFFILLPFQSLSLSKQRTVNIVTPHTVRNFTGLPHLDRIF